MTITDHELTETSLDELFELDGEEAGTAAGDGVAGEVPAVPVALHLTPDNPLLRSRGILRRRSVPICGYVGLNGQGKTLTMIRDSLLSLALGRRVLSTVTLLDAWTGNPHPLFEKFEAWEQLHDFRDGDVLLDEVTGIMDARDSGMPKHVRRLLPQMRRANVMVRWTGIDWDNSDRRLRQLTQAVVRCRGKFPNRQLVRPSGMAEAVSMWAPNRMFVLTTFDAQTLTSSDDSRLISEAEHKQRKAKVLDREFVWGPAARNPLPIGRLGIYGGALAFRSYNTLDSVSSVDNSCRLCGGRVPDKVCRGH